jgi:hypothetical protein
MDGLHAVWHGGPFAPTTRYLFHPRQILFGTDPVAIDRLLLDVIDEWWTTAPSRPASS